jgi:hypothetical protein
MDHMLAADGKQISDPKSIAKALIDAVECELPPLHLPLGEDAYSGIERHLSRTVEDISLGRETSLATGYHAVAPW